MAFNEDRLIQTSFPFLRDDTVLYVGGSSGTSLAIIAGCREELSSRFHDSGYRFLFLPELVESLSPEMLSYLFPGQSDSIHVTDLYNRIRYEAKLVDVEGFLYRKFGQAYFYPINFSPEEGIPAILDDFISNIQANRIDDLYPGSEPNLLDESESITGEKASVKHQKRRIAKFRLPSRMPDLYEIIKTSEDSGAVDYSRIPPITEDEPLDTRAQAILEAWERFKREFGITLEDLDFLLGYSVKLSRLYITSNNRIYLPDWDGKPEVKMDDLTKSLYFFYLRHPRGAAFKELQDFESEVYQIYLSITGRDDLEGIQNTVARLVSPYSDVRNSCVSRIKKAFRDIVGDRIAKYYYISGRAGENRSVSLDRDLVIWQH